MATTTLGTPLADDAVRAVNFFNGRLLTGGDLSREQDARRLADRRVAQATGPGVAWGLEVSPLAGTPVGRIRVTAGLGVSPSGLVLNLAGDAVVQLVPPPAEVQAALGSGGFSPCGSLPGATAPAADGLYLLTLAPLSLAEGWAPVLALDDVNKRCSTDVYAEAAQLRLLTISGMNLGGSDEASVARLRNQLAYAYFDAERVAAAHARPGDAPEPVPLVTDGRTPCDLPLAVVHMRANAVVFVDNWAVRRRLAPRAASAAYGDWVGDTGSALGEAQMLQFQAQAEPGVSPQLLAGPATARLDWLPPAGFLPEGTAFAVLQAFLGGRAPAREMRLAASDAPAVLAAALRADAVKLSAPVAGSTYRAWRLGGPGGPLLFARDQRNGLAAEQLWLDDARAALPGAADVQTGIDRLSAALAALRAQVSQLRDASCLHVVLRPDLQLLEPLLALNGSGRDVALCLEPGSYELQKPLELKGLGRLEITGHGARLRAAGSAVALRVSACAELLASDLVLEGTAAGNGVAEESNRIDGALTVLDTERVRLQRVRALSADGRTFDVKASCITVRHSKTGRCAAELSDCEAIGGDSQYGFLCLNLKTVLVSGCQVSARKADKPLRRCIHVDGLGAAGPVRIERNLLSGSYEGISIGLHTLDPSGITSFRPERLVIAHNRVSLALSAQATSAGRSYTLGIGEADTLRLESNQLVADPAVARQVEHHAISLLGQRYGVQLTLRDNLVDGSLVGIAMRMNDAPQPKVLMWLFSGNVGTNLAGNLFEISAKVRERAVFENNAPAN